MSLTRDSFTTSSTTQSVKHHLSLLIQSDVPNYRVSGTAAGSFLLVSCVSALSDCGSATTYLTLLLGVANGAMYVNQNWESTCEVASNSIHVIGTGLSNTVTAIKQNEWLNEKYNTASIKMHSLFGGSSPKSTTVHNQDDQVEEELKIKKNI